MRRLPLLRKSSERAPAEVRRQRFFLLEYREHLPELGPWWQRPFPS